MVLTFAFSSCESAEEKTKRMARKEAQRIELEEKRKSEEAVRAYKLEQEQIKREERLEQERQEKDIYDKYINNSLSTGSTPYSYCYGKNKSCSEYGCSQIKVTTPYNSDVLVTIKRNDIVVRHAYIKAGSSYTFEIPDGTYQPFFYYGKGWNPEKVMKQTSSGTLKGGFISNESFGKDSPQRLSNEILEYRLILQHNGNFSTQPSNVNDAL
ncbi:hypothetical protein M2137_000357 [Parabacteroides sp. PFB2-10]|nr:hypothetical protein [Parabacteroides sp. PFB2-10]